MAERGTPVVPLADDPLVRALVACIREVAERRAALRAEQRPAITAIGGKEDRAA